MASSMLPPHFTLTDPPQAEPPARGWRAWLGTGRSNPLDGEALGVECALPWVMRAALGEESTLQS